LPRGHAWLLAPERAPQPTHKQEEAPMPSGITDTDSTFSVRERPWHGLGAVLDRPPSSVAEALELSGLDWEVEQVGLRTDHGDPVPGVVANVRLDTRQILGVVSTRYTVVQNVEALRFSTT
jgi:hypothetical protein